MKRNFQFQISNFKKSKNIVKDISTVIKKNLLILVIVSCVGFVGLVSIYRTFFQEPTYIYVRVKVGQGYWWASTQKPSMWYVRAIQTAKEERDLKGEPIAQILRVAYYPWYGSNTFDIYVTLKLKVTKVGNKKAYNFKRDTIAVSTPIDLEFPTVHFSGTITALSEKPFEQNLTDKTVYLTKKYTYPWEYDAIQIGDFFNDGNSNVVEVLEKAKGDTTEVYVSELGKLLTTESETYRYIHLKVKMRLRPQNDQWLYGEEIIVSPGRVIGFVTNNFTFNDYAVSKIE